MSSAKCVTTKCGAGSEVHEGHKYTLNRHKNAGQSFKRECPAELHKMIRIELYQAILCIGIPM